MTTHTKALEQTLGSDQILSSGEHAGLVQLARALAKELDRQADTLPTRTLAAYLSTLSQIRRIVRDAQDERKGIIRAASASRVGAIKADIATARAKGATRA